MSGFGADSALGGFPRYDPVVQAMVGLMSINGTETSGAIRLGTPIKLSRTPGGTRNAPPRFNEHGEAVLRARGSSEEEIAELAWDGVLVGAGQQ